MIVGGYTLHLYCDFHPADANLYAPADMGDFAGSTLAICYTEARRAGWSIYPAQGKAKCPACVAKGKK